MDAPAVSRWRRAATQLIDDALLKTIRTSLRDPVARYFDHADDPDHSSPRLERATQIELLRLVSNAPPSALQKSNLAIAAAMRRDLLKPASDEPPRSIPDAWGASLVDFGGKYGAWAGTTPAVELRRFEETGRGLAASVDLEAGDAVLAIPEALLLGNEGVLSHPQIGPALREIARRDMSPVTRMGEINSLEAETGIDDFSMGRDGVAESSIKYDGEDEEVMDGVLHGDILLALALLLEPILRPNGAWSEYCSYLPEAPPSALHWSHAQLLRLAATPLPQQVSELREVLFAAHAALFPALSEKLPDFFPPEAFSWERFLWAYTIVQSRGLVIGGDAAMRQRRTVLAPIADMLNHSARSQLAWPTLETSENGAGGAQLDMSVGVSGSKGHQATHEVTEASGNSAGEGLSAAGVGVSVIGGPGGSAQSDVRVEVPASNGRGSGAGSEASYAESEATAGRHGSNPPSRTMAGKGVGSEAADACSSAESEAALGHGSNAARAQPCERSLVFRTLCPVRRGEEVFLYYGRLSCLQTLEHYGFVCSRALEREVVAVDLEPPEEEEGGEEGGGERSEEGDAAGTALGERGAGAAACTGERGMGEPLEEERGKEAEAASERGLGAADQTSRLDRDMMGQAEGGEDGERGKRAAAAGEQGICGAADQTSQLRLNMMLRFGLVHYLRPSAPLPSKLLGALRLGTAPSAELRRLARMRIDAAAGPLSRESEMQCCAVLNSILDSMEAGLELGAEKSPEEHEQKIAEPTSECCKRSLKRQDGQSHTVNASLEGMQTSPEEQEQELGMRFCQQERGLEWGMEMSPEEHEGKPGTEFCPQEQGHATAEPSGDWEATALGCVAIERTAAHKAVVCGDSESTGDGHDVDRAISAYVAFQRRVIQHARAEVARLLSLLETAAKEGERGGEKRQKNEALALVGVHV
jgi:hypothetical protein